MANISHLSTLQRQLPPEQAILLSNPADVEYFTDFEHLVPEEREALVLVTNQQVYLIKGAFSPFEHVLSAGSELVIWEDCRPNALLSHLKNFLALEKVTTLLVDIADLRVNEYQAIQTAIVATHVETKLQPLDKHLIWRQRFYKDASELGKMRQAAKIALSVLAAVPEILREGMTEDAVALQLEELLRQHGSPAPAFPTIVAFGANGALPHHQPGNTKLRAEMSVLVDLGATFEHYCSDFTRTLWFGSKPSAEFMAAEEAVKAAYEAAWAVCRIGAKAQDLDLAARVVLQQAGMADAFIHTTGHGLGLEIHEPPSLSSQNGQILGENMVITIEPGVYFPGKFGYRYENTVWLSDQRPVVLGK